MCRRAIGRVKQWLFERKSDEPGRAPRSRVPELVVHYWDGSIPEGHNIREIGLGGVYIYTSERWYPGTIVRVVLQAYGRTLRSDGATAPTASNFVLGRLT